MAENLFIPVSVDRETIFKAIIPQMKELIRGEKNFIANCANGMAVLKSAFNFHWVGCYFVENYELVLGPFQGPVACTRIQKGKGVCGAAWEKNETIIVPDVEQFPGHIACSALSKSEIVVPIHDSRGEIIGVLDIDSDRSDDFSETDKFYLEQIVDLLASSYVG